MSFIRKQTGHYFGPGNISRLEGNTKVPIDKTDYIAAEHDDNYTAAKDKEDIYRADREAIKQFSKHAFSEGSIKSGIGAVGLGAKHIFEKATNNIYYPSITGKQWHLLKKETIMFV